MGAKPPRARIAGQPGRWSLTRRILVAVSLAAVAAAAVWIWPAGSLPPLPEPVLDGFAGLVQKQLESALEAAASAPRDARAVGALGRALYAYGQYEAAGQCFERCLGLEPDGFEWAYLLGLARSDLGQFDAASAAFARAVSVRPDDLPTAIRRADLLERSGESAGSRSILEAALHNAPRSPAVRYRLARLDAAEDPAAAAEDLRAALAVEPDYREALYALAGVYRSLGRHADADRQLALYEQADPSPRRHYSDPVLDALDEIRAGSVQEAFNDGRAFQQGGDLQMAITSYAAALEIDPNYVQAHVNLVAVHGELGNHEQAALHYRRSVELDPSIAEAHYNYGVSRHFAEDFDGAAEAFEKALAINPLNADAHSNLGASLDAIGRHADAGRQYLRALEHNPSHPMANFHVGRRLAEAGKYRQALPYLERAVGTDSEGTPLHAFVLALVYRELGQSDRSREYGRLALLHARERGASALEARITAELDP